MQNPPKVSNVHLTEAEVASKARTLMREGAFIMLERELSDIKATSRAVLAVLDKLLDRELSYCGAELTARFSNHSEAFNTVLEARRAASELSEKLGKQRTL